MREILDALRDNADALTATLEAIFDLAGRLKLDLSTQRSTAGLVADMIFARVNALAEGAVSLAATDEQRLLLAPVSRLAAFRDQISNLNSAAHNLFTTLSQIEPVGIQQSDEASGTITGNNGTNINFRSNLDEVLVASDKPLDAFIVLSAVARPKGIGTYAAASRSLSSAVTKAGEVLDQLKQQAASFSQKVEEVTTSATEASRAQNEAQRLAQEIEKARRTAEENEQRILAAATAAEESRAKAASVDAQVQEYEDQFKAFQSLLNARETALKKGNEELVALQKALTDKESQVSDLVGKATKMLGGATIAGLSSTYHDKANEVDSQLFWARLGFYASIAILVISVLVALRLTTLWGLITGTLVPIPTITPGADAGTLAVQTLASLGSRALVVLPSLLLAGFAAHRHAALFRLREEYSHKKALAVSVQGFKEQAPAYQEPIAAAVFQELLSNPASSMDKDERSKRPNGFIQRLVAPAVEESLRKMLELRDGAGSQLTGGTR